MATKVKLRKFSMERELWGRNEGKFKVAIALEIDKHDVTFHLPPEVGHKVIELCGAELYGNALQVADSISDLFEALVKDKAISWDDPNGHLPFVDGAKL